MPVLPVPNNVRDRCDDATCVARVGPGFSHLADVAPIGPDDDPRFSLFRFEVRVGDRVRFRLRAEIPAEGETSDLPHGKWTGS